MSYFRQFSLGLCISGSLILTGCQNIQQSSLPKTDLVSANNQFQLNGKIGIRTPQQSGSAFFTWVQQDEQFELELTGILGVGKTQISGQPGQVTLNSAKTGLIEADSAEELLQRATGWQAPITHLVDWVQARPATRTAELNKDESNRIQQIIEDGWTVNLSYNQNANVPNRLILKQTLENGAENRITMLIQNR